MACGDKNQSAIEEARDQLFLDTADGARLTAVTGNLGIDRPGFGFGDDEWRAIGKFVGIQSKQIRNIFYRMIELCLGPQFARIGTLENAVQVADNQLIAIDPSPFIQLGTLVIDPTLPTEETISYCIRDLTTGVFFLSTALKNFHPVIPPGSGQLSATAAAAATTLQLIDSSGLPDPSLYPFPIIVERGTIYEEVVKVIGNDTSTGVLTLDSSTPLVFQHDGPDTLFLTVQLAADAPQGRTFLQFEPGATRGFPASGWVRVNHSGGNDEVVQFVSNDVATNALMLKTPLKNAHVALEHVELVRPGASVEVCQLLEQGVHWELWETAPRKVEVIIPKDFKALGPLDATWLHQAVPAAVSTTTTISTLATDFAIPVTSVSGFPDYAGMVTLNGAPAPVGFIQQIAAANTVATVAANTASGALTMLYALDQASPADMPATQRPFWVVIDSGGGSEETVRVLSTDQSTGRLHFAAPLTNAHTAGQTIGPVDQILLDEEAGGTLSPGATVALFSVPYLGFPALEQGNNRDAFGSVQLNRFPGGYIYNNLLRGVSATSTFLSAVIPPVITIASPQIVGRTNLEVDDASEWPAPPFSPFKVRVDEGSGGQEDRTLIDRTLRTSATGTTPASSIGDTSMAYTLTSSGEFPESDGVHAAGYRIILDKGGANQEIAVVAQNVISSHTFSFITPLTHVHGSGESIALLDDVLTFDLLTRAHPTPGGLVHAYTSDLFVSPAPTTFPSAGGWLWLNFGKEILNVRKRITVITSATSYVLMSTADLPTSGYPYQLILSDGQFSEEPVFVTNNNTSTNTLTFQSPGALSTHNVGEYASFISGDPESIEYETKEASPDRLVFSTPVLLQSGHLVGERVMYSPEVSESHSDGSSYGFKLPPDVASCLTTMFEMVRAAGIQVSITLK